jgi:hypothetical protein
MLSMASFITSLSESINNFRITDFTNRICELAGRCVSLETLPNENMIVSIVRTIFEMLAALIIVGAFSCALPFMWVGHTIYEFVRPSEHYVIDGREQTVNNKVILKHLESMEKSEYKFTTIEIQYTSGSKYEAFDDKILESIRRLQPHNLILVNAVVNESLAKDLDTNSHFYTFNSYDLPSKNKGCTLECQEKIKKVVLPSDPEELLAKLQALVDAKQRIDQLYFTTVTPKGITDRLNNLRIALGEPMEFLVLTEKAPKAIAARL